MPRASIPQHCFVTVLWKTLFRGRRSEHARELRNRTTGMVSQNKQGKQMEYVDLSIFHHSRTITRKREKQIFTSSRGACRSTARHEIARVHIYHPSKRRDRINNESTARGIEQADRHKIEKPQSPARLHGGGVFPGRTGSGRRPPHRISQ